MRMKRILAYILMSAMLTGNTVSASASGNVTVTEVVEETATEETTEPSEPALEIISEEESTEAYTTEEAVETTLPEETSGEETSGEGTSEEDISEENTSVEESSSEVMISTEETMEDESASESVTEEQTTEEESTVVETTVAAEAESVETFGEAVAENVNLYVAMEADGEYVLEGSFASLQDALDTIDDLANHTNYYKVELVSAAENEVTYGAQSLVFPSKAAEVVICADKELTEPRLYFKGNLTLKSNLVFEDIVFVPHSDSSIVLGGYELTLTRCLVNNENEFDFAGIKGSGINGTSSLILDDTDFYISGAVNNVGSLVFAGENVNMERTLSTVPEASSLTADGKINIGSIKLETDGYLTGPATVTRKNGVIKKITPQITIGSEVYSESNQTLYLDLTEKVSGEYISLNLDKEEATDIQKSGVPFAKATKVSYPNVKAAQRNEADNLTKASGYLTYYAEGYGVILSFVEDGQENSIPCRTFADAVTEINNRKVKLDYVITLTEDCAVTSGVRQDILNTTPKALTMPNKKYVNSLVIQTDPEAADTEGARLGFTGNITFTSDVTLRNVQLVQLVKAGSSYVPADTAKDDYPATVTIKTGGFDLNVEGEVTINAPLILNGGNKGALMLDETGTINTVTNDFEPSAKNRTSVIYGSITGWNNLTLSGRNLTIKEYRTSRTGKTYKASTNKITTLHMTDANLSVIGDNAKGSLTVQDLHMDNGEVYVGGKVSIKNATLEGTQKATIFADTNFTITGTLTSKSNNATLLTRLKGAKKAPYLTVNGKVVREAGIKPIYVGVYPEATASAAIRDKAVVLTNAPKVTAQLLTAKSALAVDFHPIAENYPSGSGEYHKDNTSGYMMLKSGKNIYVYDGSTVKVAVYAKTDAYTKEDDGELFGFFPSIKEATSAVNSRKDKTASYTYVLMEVNGTAAAPTAMSLPTYAKKVTIKSIPDCREEMKTITFSGNMTLGTDTVLEDIVLSPVKNKKPTTVTITGKNKALTLHGVDIPGNVSGTSRLTVKEDGVISGNLKTTGLQLENNRANEAVTLSVGGTVTVTDLINNGNQQNVLEYTRSAKNVSNLTINGTITNESTDKPVIFRQTDGKTVKLLYKDGNRVTLSNAAMLAVVPKASTDSFLLEGTTFVSGETENVISSVRTVKAAKGIYAVDSSDTAIARDLVKLEETADGSTTTTECLDYAQAINEINNRKHQTSKYRILLEAPNATPMDTNLTDKNHNSALPLPKKNMASALTIAPVHDGYASIPYTGNITGFGNITFQKLRLTPAQSGSNAALGTSSLKVTADKSGANVTFSSCSDTFLTSGINVAGTLTLKETKVLSDKTSTANHLVLDEISSWDSIGKLTLTSVSVPEEANTSYVGVKQNTKGVPQFTLKKEVNGGVLQIRVYDSTTTKVNGTSIFYGNSDTELDSYLNVSLVSAGKEAAEKFRAYPYRAIDGEGTVAENADGITKDNLVAYKDGVYVKNGTAESMLKAFGESELLSTATDAKEALEKLTQEKDIYALVYLTDSYDVKESPSHVATTVATLNSAHTVQILGMEVEWSYSGNGEEYIPTVWYYVQFYVGDTLYKGYIEERYLAYSDELLLQWKNDWYMLFPSSNSSYSDSYGSGAAAYADVEQFPTSYQVHLNKVKASHPNWTFVPMNVGRNWDDCVNEQMGDYSWIYYNQPAQFRGAQINSTWYYASREGIAYYMDPRNFLTESNIFQFEQNTYNESYHTQSALQTFLNGTFMAGKVPGDSSGRTYANVIWNSGKTRGLSPFNLAARVIQEQGINGTSAMISGTYAGFEGYYNFYNIGASGTTDAEVLKNGLTYAKNQGWNTRVKSLNGGAAFIGNGYILQGQDTLYLQKFDIEHGSSSLHQYMQNIMAPYTEGRSMKTMYTNAGSLNSSFVFKIPVFDNMPGADYTLSHKSLKLEKGKTKKITVKCDGIAVPEGTAVFESDAPEVATVSQSGLITAVGSGQTTITAAIGEGDSEIKLTCKVTVYAPLKSIALSAEDTNLYVAEGLPDQVPVLNENGETVYLDKADCATQTTLTVSYNPDDTTDDRTVKWTVENPDIVTVTQDPNDVAKAFVTAKSGGTTKITAKVGKYTAEVTITVRVPMREAALKLEGETLTLYKGQTQRVSVSYLPYNTTDTIDPAFSSENESVAKIVDGEIVAIGPGTTTLHAAVGPFDGTQTALTCEIQVKEYTVTFTDADGSTLLTVPGEYGSKLETLESEEMIPWTQEKDGYIFIGWYTEPDGKGYAVDEQSILHGDMVLYPYFVDAATGFYAKPIGDVDYTGAYVKPAVEVYHGDKLLEKGTDYTVAYVNNKAVNDTTDPDARPTAVITGKGAYVGTTIRAEFNIVPKDISHTDVTAGNLLVAYTGKEQQLRPVLYDGGRTLQRNVDYTLSYPENDTESGAYLEAGTYAVEVSGTGNYSGTRTVHVSISKRTLLSNVTIGGIKDVKFNNGNEYDSVESVEECEPAVSLTYAGKKLVENTDYTLSYRNNKEIGVGTVTITGMGDYIGTVEKSFRITGTNISTTKINGTVGFEYTGEPILQDVDAITVTGKDKSLLRNGLDYVLSYEKNESAGKAYMVVTGINGYTGSVKTAYTIQAYDIAQNTQSYAVKGEGDTLVTKPAFEIVLEHEQVNYDKAGAKAVVSVTFKGHLLKEGVDYKLTYQNNHVLTGESGTQNAMVTVTGIGNFKGNVIKSFSVLEKDLTKVSMTAKDVAFRNRKGYCFVEPVLTDESKRRLKAGTDFEEELLYSYVNDTVLYNGEERKAGETVRDEDIPAEGTVIRVTAIGMGNYTGTISCEYQIQENTSWFSNLFS